MIVKVQLPLATTEPEPLALVYNEDRSVMEQFPVSQELVDAMNGRPKAFFHAHVDDSGVLHLDDEAPWQDW